MRATLATATVLLLGSWGCQTVLVTGTCARPTGQQQFAGSSGSYSYTACSAGGDLLVVGSLTISVKPDSTIQGTWQAQLAPGVPAETNVGPQVGSGTLEGRVLPTGGVTINLNPGMADNNVFLSGTQYPNAYAGTWSYDTFAGPTATGQFFATSRP